MNHLLGMLAALALIGCGDGGKGPPGGSSLLDVDGDATGAPDDSVIAVAWVVSSGSPDYAYKFGEATTSSGSFLITFDAEPPAVALNNGTIGIGVVFQLPPGTSLPEGMIPDAQFDSATGFSSDHSIIFKTEGAPSGEAQWLDAFPSGYSCGVCVRSGTGFDAYQKTDCSNVKVEQGNGGELCNFT